MGGGPRAGGGVVAHPAAGDHDPVLLVSSVSRSYGRQRVLTDVNLGVRPGELVGVVGENGAGKTTLLRILAGQLRPDGGTVRVRGSLGYCPQQAVVNEALTVGQHLRLFQVAYRLQNDHRARELAERLGLTRYERVPAGVLSGGNQQKLNLVLALMHDPAVVLLDEPYQGFDWETYLRFWDLADDLRARGRAILVISHLAHDIERLDRLHRLRAGALRGPGTEDRR
ncbi:MULTISPECIES: ABC transporter ATP-binding protein [Actinoalloteichus]|uniref:ABC-type multidrug transport system, ATPase component n=1 Tax=Actinoalloteichus caeruleus DSM 43889 TaxID=1120930 RepID=A0ABT1JNK9_ACTCY|nr:MULTISPECIES: ABC transporter ATP-binding protein [Actinoalloteichus]MCP2334118.1 ABC-type multidrug transport system, ATPase component [Actinoalloteichus caeruleus DSM 43889]